MNISLPSSGWKYSGVLLVRREDVPHDGRGRKPLTTAHPKSCLSVTADSVPVEDYNIRMIF
jgi:hypothetical protein